MSDLETTRKIRHHTLRPPEEIHYVPTVRRDKRARKSVLLAEKIAGITITWGGIAVIMAVLGIMVFLVVEVAPLFFGGKITAEYQYRLDLPEAPIISAVMDEYDTLVVLAFQNGEIMVVHSKTGRVIDRFELSLGGRLISTFASTPNGTHIAIGLDNGSVVFGEVSFGAKIIPEKDTPPGLKRLDRRDRTNGRYLYSTVPGRQIRRIGLDLKMSDPVEIFSGGQSIVDMDYRVSGEAERHTRVFAALSNRGDLKLKRLESRLNLLTGDKREKAGTIDLPRVTGQTGALRLILSDKADQVYLAYQDGRIARYNTADPDNPFLAETIRVLPEGVALSSVGFLLGSASLVVGGSDGRLNNYFFLGDPAAQTRDGHTLVLARTYPSGNGAIQRINPSLRNKSFAVADRSGAIRLIHGTSRKKILEFIPEKRRQYEALVLSPRFDGLWMIDQTGRADMKQFEAPHPETSIRTLFGKVWYEGYQAPTYTWQSSAATDDFEAKLSLAPLIFGTIKATVYALLFAIPIALLGAVYTSEILHPRMRAVVKPLMESMASLPSVVLGFLAALVLAPVVESWIGAILLSFLAVPAGLILAAHLWQMLPAKRAQQLDGPPKLGFMLAVILLGILVTITLFPHLERIIFNGPFKGWLNGDNGGPASFLFLILLPVVLWGTALVFDRWVNPRINEWLSRQTRKKAAFLDLARWLAYMGLSGLATLLFSHILALIGVDARDGLVGTYVQRNTFVVGFAMGVTVIPIIYTLAEDALDMVPRDLRAASLACGASHWQTARWVVIPTAVSGIFSAIMVGMGRAAGETMIVVMAAGNTPLMDWNVFNGLRALSATIAVELPEAVRGGTLYRVLFLAALALFVMTFIINTVSELVRQHYRNKANQL